MEAMPTIEASNAGISDRLQDEQERWQRRSLRNRVALFLVFFIGATLSMLMLAS